MAQQWAAQQPQCAPPQPVALPQPAAHPFSAVSGAVNYVNVEREFRHGLFDCCGAGCGLCCEAWCCNVCQTVRINSALAGRADYPNWPLCCGISCLDIVCTKGLAQCFFDWANRQDIRRRMGIRGNACKDCMAITCCRPCANVQMHRELSEHGLWPGACCCAAGGYCCCAQPRPAWAPPPGYIAPVPQLQPGYQYAPHTGAVAPVVGVPSPVSSPRDSTPITVGMPPQGHAPWPTPSPKQAPWEAERQQLLKE